MFAIFKGKPQEVEIGPDGMSDFSRQMHEEWARRDRAMAKVEAAMAAHGIDETLRNQLPYHYIVAALVLGVDLKE
jgi:hypothetical protein